MLEQVLQEITRADLLVNAESVGRYLLTGLKTLQIRLSEYAYKFLVVRISRSTLSMCPKSAQNWKNLSGYVVCLCAVLLF
ncbi:hypothetical protein ElyMa_005514200 [Elysia marginata]|uniref:Uncharacterized protein n=1 Tax=Elysia marginata TaxID=1093978 RepID=A0AAV4EUR6_9GAST|nr:hypothetical protein ElyMa_005514200 [Elysia marginata]